MRKNIDIAGFTEKQRLDELERVKAKYSKKGYTFVNYTDHGMTKSFATFEIDEANIKQGSGLFKKIFLGIIVVIIVLIIIAPSDNEEKETQSKPQITYNLKELKDNAVYILDTTIYQKNDPKYVYARFLNAWEDKDYEKMVKLTTNEWKYKQQDPVQSLKDIYKENLKMRKNQSFSFVCNALFMMFILISGWGCSSSKELTTFTMLQL